MISGLAASAGPMPVANKSKDAVAATRAIAVAILSKGWFQSAIFEVILRLFRFLSELVQGLVCSDKSRSLPVCEPLSASALTQHALFSLTKA